MCFNLKVITFCADGLLHFAPKGYYILRKLIGWSHYYILGQGLSHFEPAVYYILRHGLLHFAAGITFCVKGYYILRQVLHFALVLHFAPVQAPSYISPFISPQLDISGTDLPAYLRSISKVRHIKKLFAPLIFSKKMSSPPPPSLRPLSGHPISLDPSLR